jgi:heme A synthase
MIRIGNPWLQRYAVLLAAAGLFSIVTGAAFTTNEERPLYSFGQSHLIVGVFTGVLAIGLAIRLLLADKRAWMRLLAWITLAVVTAEGLLGFITGPQPPAVRFAHALLAQLFFATTVVVAAFTSRAGAQVPMAPGPRGSLRILAMITAFLVLAQTALGVAFRHGIIDVIPHVLGALVVTIFVAAFAMLAIYRHENEPLRSAGATLLIITGVQFFLGLTLYAIGLDADIDPEAVIVVTIVHAAAAALTLAATAVAVALVLRAPRRANR